MELSSKPSKSFLVADRVFVATYTLESTEFVYINNSYSTQKSYITTTKKPCKADERMK